MHLSRVIVKIFFLGFALLVGRPEDREERGQGSTYVQ